MMELDLDLKVLVVEDAPSMQRIIRHVLKDFGYKDIRLASNGRDGLNQIKAGGFGLVIADWNMPEMSGLEMLQAIRSDMKLADLPVVMITARNERENIEQARQAGVSAYLIKPFEPEVLEEELHKIFKSQQLCRPQV